MYHRLCMVSHCKASLTVKAASGKSAIRQSYCPASERPSQTCQAWCRPLLACMEACRVAGGSQGRGVGAQMQSM